LLLLLLLLLLLHLLVRAAVVAWVRAALVLSAPPVCASVAACSFNPYAFLPLVPLPHIFPLMRANACA
jgi:hypothetical protein